MRNAYDLSAEGRRRKTCKICGGQKIGRKKGYEPIGMQKVCRCNF